MLNYLENKLGSKSYTEMVDAYQQAYRRSHTAIDENKTAREAANEMVNDTLFTLFSSKEGMQDMIDWTSEAMPTQERKTFLETFKTILDDVIKALDHFLKTGSFNSAERAALEMEKDQAKAMRKMVLDAMDIAIENRDKAAGAQSESVESSDARSSRRPKEQSKLKQDITAVMNGKYSEKYVSFGQTPAIYRTMLGVRNIPLMMTANHTYSVAVSEKKAKSDGKYRSNANYHNLGAETLSELPKALKNPAIILKSNNDTADSRFVSVVELYDKENRPIIAAIEIEASTMADNKKIESVNLILSTYGRNNYENYIKNAISENRVLYVNKIKSQQLYEAARVQYPRSLLTANFDNNLDSFKQIVNRKVDNSTRNSIKVEDSEGHKLTEAQQKFFVDSKAVDEDGDLQVVYHGTVREFYEFDRSQGNPEGNFGTGIYFTNDIGDVDENYANENGADLTSKIQLEAEMLEGSEEYEDMDVDEIVEILKEKYITSDEPIAMKCYLNIENPCYVESTMLLDDIKDYMGETIEDFEDEDEYYYALEEKTAEIVDDIISDITDNIELYSDTDEIAAVLNEAVMDGGIAVEDLRGRLDELYLEDEQGRIVSSEVLRQIIESLGYDGIIDNTVSKKFENMHLDEGTTHYIVFNSNQAKFVTNENPTDSPDVRKSIKVNDLADKLNYDEYRRVKRWIDNNDKPTFIAKRGETKGDKVLRLDNKLVYTDFKKGDFGISKIVSAEYQDSEMITVALDTYTDYEEGVVNEQQLCEIIESFFGAENFREYTSKGRTAGERYDRPTKRNKGRSDAYHAEREQNRKRVFIKDGVVVEDTRKSVKVTNARNSFKEYGEASPYTNSLEEVEVVSTILSKANQALGGIKSVKESSLNRISRSVIKKYKSNVEVEELSKNIFQAFSQMAENKLESNYESVMDYMLNIGDEVIANSQLKDPDSERVYNEARKNLQSYNIKLTETDKEELKNAYGTLIKGMGTLKKHGINLSKEGHLSRYSLT